MMKTYNNCLKLLIKAVYKFVKKKKKLLIKF